MSKPSKLLSLLLITGLMVLFFFGHRYPPEAQAMTAHGNSAKTMVTVPVDSGLEAVVTLDHATGDLTGYVLDRISGRFFVRYRHNVSSDFTNSKGDYLMGAGLIDFRGFEGNERVASGVVYIAESNSSQVLAYAIPWNPQLATSVAEPQERAFIPLDRAQTRFTQRRD